MRDVHPTTTNGSVTINTALRDLSTLADCQSRLVSESPESSYYVALAIEAQLEHVLSLYDAADLDDDGT